MSGWIKIHRTITEHWLYTEKRVFSRFEAWNDILLTVNFTEAQTLIKGRVYTIKRGESILSLDSWAKRWGWDKSKVRRFMILLVKESMIELKSDNITTHLIVCKYDTYQAFRNANETQTKPKQNTDETQTTPIEEEEERKEEKEEEDNNGGVPVFSFKKSLLELGIEKSLVKTFLEIRHKKRAVNSEAAFNAIVREIKISGWTANDAIRRTVEKSWTTFEAKYVEDNRQLGLSATPEVKAAIKAKTNW